MKTLDVIAEIESSTTKILDLEAQIKGLRVQAETDCRKLWPLVANLGTSNGNDRQFSCGGVQYSLSVDNKLCRINELPALDPDASVPDTNEPAPPAPATEPPVDAVEVVVDKTPTT